MDRRTVLHADLVDTHKRWKPFIAQPKWLPVAFVSGFFFERLLPQPQVLREAGDALVGILRFEQLTQALVSMLVAKRAVYRPAESGDASHPGDAETATSNEISS